MKRFLHPLAGLAVFILAFVVLFGSAGLMGKKFGGLAALATMFAVLFLLKSCMDLWVKRSVQKAQADLAKNFESIRFTMNGAYPYTDHSDFFELEPEEKLVAIDISWRGPCDWIDFDFINITDPESEDAKAQKQNESNWPEFAYLDPANGRIVEHLTYRIPIEFRLLLVFVVPSKMKSFKLQFNHFDITPQPVRIADAAPADPPQAAADDFRKYVRLREDPPDYGQFRPAYAEAPKLAGKVKVNAAYQYGGLHFCEPERGDKTIAIDLSIQGMSKHIMIDRMRIIDPETGEPANFNKTLLNYVFLDPASGQICEPAVDPMPPAVRMLFIYNIPSSMDAIKLTFLNKIFTPQAVPIQSAAPFNAPRPAEADFRKAYKAFAYLLYDHEEEPEPDETAAMKE